MSTTFQLGKFYDVPAVLVNVWNGFHGWMPVIGPKHDDAEIVGFPYTHFHIDWRFASSRTFKNACRSMDESYVYGSVVQCPDSYGRRVITEGPTLKRMKCKRELPEYPVNKAKWIPALEKAFVCAKLVAGKCPHRGIPVASMIRDGDVLTCPGHGLRFNATTGELMPQIIERERDMPRKQQNPHAELCAWANGQRADSPQYERTNMSKHTPGPWRVVEHSWSDTGIYSEKHHIAHLSIEGVATESNQSQLEASMDANAKLIAAAPELLEVLQALVNVADSNPHMSIGHLIEHGAVTNRARAIIDEATR